MTKGQGSRFRKDKHSSQIFDWLRALITIIFSQPNKPISTQDSHNKVTSQLELGPFSPFHRVFTTLSTKNIARLYKANFHLIFCPVHHHALLFDLYWRHCAIGKSNIKNTSQMIAKFCVEIKVNYVFTFPPTQALYIFHI